MAGVGHTWLGGGTHGWGCEAPGSLCFPPPPSHQLPGGGVQRVGGVAEAEAALGVGRQQHAVPVPAERGRRGAVGFRAAQHRRATDGGGAGNVGDRLGGGHCGGGKGSEVGGVERGTLKGSEVGGMERGTLKGSEMGGQGGGDPKRVRDDGDGNGGP